MNLYEGKKLVELSDWKDDLSKILEKDCFVSGEIVWELINCVPPRFWNGFKFQVGEPYSTKIDERTGEARQTYTSFVLVKSDPDDCTKDIYKYVGHCFGGEFEERGKEIQYS